MGKPTWENWINHSGKMETNRITSGECPTRNSQKTNVEKWVLMWLVQNKIKIKWINAEKIMLSQHLVPIQKFNNVIFFFFTKWPNENDCKLASGVCSVFVCTHWCFYFLEKPKCHLYIWKTSSGIQENFPGKIK